MQNFDETKPRNVITIDISPAQMTRTHTEKKDREENVKKIVSSTCALINSGGGTLRIRLQNVLGRQYADILRMIEQRMIDIMGSASMITNIKFEIRPNEIILCANDSTQVISLSYNLYLPSQTQVMALPPTEPIEKVKEIIRAGNMESPRNYQQIGSHCRQFLKGALIEVLQNDAVQLKNLKAVRSKCVTLGDRMTCKTSKLSCYISAFANHSGGHIYYGVTDDRVVEGEEIVENDKQDITKKVAKAINKMIWPEYCRKPRRGEQWDIFFEPVKGNDGNLIPGTFVIVISVARCPGGVFTEEPESYHIVKDKVRKMDFEEWWRHVTGNSRKPGSFSVTLRNPRFIWSSSRSSKIYRWLTAQLLYYTNDRKVKDLAELENFVKKKYPDSCATLVVMSEKVAVSYKSYFINKSEVFLSKFMRLLNKDVKDCIVFEVRAMYLSSRIERAKGNNEMSYAIAQDGLQKMQLIQADFITVWFYMHAAMLALTLSSTEQDTERSAKLAAEARRYMDCAQKDANALADFPKGFVDLRQKLQIYKAMILLGCSLTGEATNRKPVTYHSNDSINDATSELLAVHNSILNGYDLTHFRKIQFLLVQCDLFYRLANTSSHEDYRERLKRAFEYAKEAQVLAKKYQFEESFHIANERLSDLTEKLICRTFLRSALKLRDSENVCKDLENFVETEAVAVTP